MKKTWFITGCSKGFGKFITEELLKTTDDNVVATARDPKALNYLIKEYSSRLKVLRLDVAIQVEIKKAVEESIARFKTIDVLVNNAGYGLIGALEECSMDEIRAIFETNVFGLMEVTKAILPHMRAKGSGHIINLSSSAGVMSSPGLGIYNSTKFAVEGLSEALSLDLDDFGIKVTIIEPGPFRTDFAGGSIKKPMLNADYANSKASGIREYIEKFNNTQPGDPLKAAQIMIQVANMANPPLRLALGNLSVDRIADKLNNHMKELKKYESLSRSADFEQG